MSVGESRSGPRGTRQGFRWLKEGRWVSPRAGGVRDALSRHGYAVFSLCGYRTEASLRRAGKWLSGLDQDAEEG